MGLRILVVAACAALATAACGGAERKSRVPVDSELTAFEPPADEELSGEEGGGDMFSDEAFEDLEDEDAGGEGEAAGRASNEPASGSSDAAPEGGDKAGARDGSKPDSDDRAKPSKPDSPAPSPGAAGE